MTPDTKRALDWERDLDILKVNIENLPKKAGLTANEIAILLMRIGRLKTFIRQALTAPAVEKIEGLEDGLKKARKFADGFYEVTEPVIRGAKAYSRIQNQEENNG